MSYFFVTLPYKGLCTVFNNAKYLICYKQTECLWIPCFVIIVEHDHLGLNWLIKKNIYQCFSEFYLISWYLFSYWLLNLEFVWSWYFLFQKHNPLEFFPCCLQYQQILNDIICHIGPKKILDPIVIEPQRFDPKLKVWP